LPSREYAGSYQNPIYGTITVVEDRQGLRLNFGTRFRGEMRPWGENQFRVFFSTAGLDDWLVTFAVRDEHVHSLHVQESPWAPEWYDDRDDLGDFTRMKR
jgi:hypothetical protein